MKKNQIIIFLILIIALGGFLRLYHIGNESFWLDESATALSIKKYSLGEIFYNTAKFGQILPAYYNSNLDLPPYYILLKAWSNVFGINETTLRAFSALFGTLSIVMVYILAKVLFNRKTAVIAALIFSLNVVMIEYSQETRLYSLLIFITLMSAYFLFKSIQTNKASYITGFIISNIVGIYTHYPFLFFMIFEFIFVFLIFIKDYLKQNKIIIKRIYFAAIFVAIAYIPLLPRILYPKLIETHFIGSFSFNTLAKLFLQLNTWIYPSQMLRDKINRNQFGLLNASEWILIISVIGVSIILFIFFLRNFLNMKNVDNKKLFLLLWLVIPSALAFVLLYPSIVTFGSIKTFVFVVPR